MLIIAVLMALLLPAIQAARDASRRSTCRSNLKQIGLALHRYHDVNKVFPPSVVMTSTPIAGWPAAYGPGRWPSWVIVILPFVEEQGLFDSFGTGKIASLDLRGFNSSTNRPITGSSMQEEAAGLAPRGTAVTLPVMQCPSDKGLDVKYRGDQLSGSSFNPLPNQFQLYARGNYAVNSCLAWPFAYNPPTNSIAPACGGIDQEYWSGPNSWSTRGVMGASCAVPINKITDGTSHTLLATEIRSGLNYRDPRGLWAPAGAGVNALWHQAGPGFPNDCETGDYLSGPIANATFTVLTGSTTAAAAARAMATADCLPIAGDADGSVRMSSGLPRSMHPGGVNVCMADGSVQFINDSIEHGTPSGSWGNYAGYRYDLPNTDRMLTWERLNASADGFLIDDAMLQP